jgi:hypothetical protein
MVQASFLSAGVYWDLIPYIKKMVEFDMREGETVDEGREGGCKMDASITQG